MKRMRGLYSLCTVLVASTFLSAHASAEPKCQGEPLSRSALLEIVRAQVATAGGDPTRVDNSARSRAEVATLGCDYLVRLTFLPETPGGFTIYRISRDKKIIDVHPGI
jgi:hypothetical protein